MTIRHTGTFLAYLFLISITLDVSRSLNNENLRNPIREAAIKEGFGNRPGSPQECRTLNETLLPGEWRSLPGCKKISCVSEEDGKVIALVLQSCDIAEDELPEGCSVVPPSSDLQFPKCCEVSLACKNVITEVYPVVFTHANISSLPRNESENLIDEEDTEENKFQKKLEQHFPSKYYKGLEYVGKIHKVSHVIRKRRDIQTNVESQASLNPKAECLFKNQSIKIGDKIPMDNCSQMECIPESNGLALIIVSCPQEEVRVPNGCEIVPPVSKNHYPECCKVVFKCVKKIITVVPIVYTSENISQLSENERENFISVNYDNTTMVGLESGDQVTESPNDTPYLKETEDQIKKLPVETQNLSKSDDQIKELPKEIQNLSETIDKITKLSKENKNSIDTDNTQIIKLLIEPINPSVNSTRVRRDVTMETRSHQDKGNDTNGCVTVLGTLRDGESISVPGCAELKCVSQNNTFALVYVSCNTTKDVPPGCRVLPQSNSTFPECCVSHLVCEKVITEVVPIIYTAENISELERNDNENNVDNRTDNIPEEKVTSHYFVDHESSERSRREVGSVTKSVASVKEEDVCITNNGTIIKKGDNVAMEDCSQLQCFAGPDGVVLSLVKCAKEEISVRDGCEILPQKSGKLFPECCVVVFRCVVPVIYTAGNISELSANESLKLVPVRNVDNGITSLKEYNNSEKESKITTEMSQRDQKRVKREKIELEFPSEDVKSEERCLVFNKSLSVGESIPLPQCAELKCISDNETTFLAVISCEKSSEENKNGCVKISSPDLQYPQCCVETWVCEKVVTEIFPVVYTSANISQLDGNNSENVIDAIDLVSNSNPEEKSVEIKINERHKREIRTNESLKKRDKGDEKGCSIRNGVLKEGDHFPLPGCARLECLVRDDIFYLVIVSCPESKQLPEGCSFLPRPNSRYPECCQSVMICKEVVTSVIPKVYSSANISNINITDNDFDNVGYILSGTNQKLEMATSESQKSRRVSNVKSIAMDKSLDKIDGLSGNRTRNRTNSSPSLSQMLTKRKRQSVPPKAESVSRPTFLLPSKTTSRNRNVNRTKENDPSVLKLKDRMFITLAPNTKLTSSTKDNIANSTANSVKRRRLSSLLSSRNLRNLTLKARVNDEVKIISLKSEIPKANQKREIISKDKLNPTEIPKIRERIKDSTNSSAAKTVAKRRKLFADRLNKFRATANIVNDTDKSKLDKKENNKKKNISVNMKKKKLKLVNKKLKDNLKEETKTSETNVETKSNKTPLLRRRLGSRRMIDIEEESIPKVEENKADNAKNVSVRARLKVNKIKDKKDKKKSADITSTKFKKRRTKKQKNKNVKKEKEGKVKTEAKDKKKEKDEKLNRGETVFNLSKIKENAIKKKEENKNGIRNRSSSRGRKERLKLKESKNSEQKTEKDTTINNESKTIKPIIQSQVSDKDTAVKTVIPVNPVKENKIITELPNYRSLYEIDYSFNPTNLDDYEKFYSFPSMDLDISSSDTEKSNSTDTKENEIEDIPKVPKVPIKITTVSFSTSRRSFKTSKTRNTSKNFKETPTVYDVQETSKSTTFRYVYIYI